MHLQCGVFLGCATPSTPQQQAKFTFRARDKTCVHEQVLRVLQTIAHQGSLHERKCRVMQASDWIHFYNRQSDDNLRPCQPVSRPGLGAPLVIDVVHWTALLVTHLHQRVQCLQTSKQSGNTTYDAQQVCSLNHKASTIDIASSSDALVALKII